MRTPSPAMRPWATAALPRLLAFLLLLATAAGAQKTPCSELTSIDPPPGSTVLNVTATERRGVAYEGASSATGAAGTVDICAVEVYATHGEAGDAVRTAVWLPLSAADWNGRFLGTGGGGFLAGYFDAALGPAVARGYAAASTDAGVGGPDEASTGGHPEQWAGDEQLVRNFVHLSAHEMAAIGKQVAERYYGGGGAHHSYWSGCSTGGRQGLSGAQRYPLDWDGILAEAPAAHWDRLVPGDFWPHVVQTQHDGGRLAGACALAALTNASIAACDGLDGARDGLVGRPLQCAFDARDLVGKSFPCTNNDTTSIPTEEEEEEGQVTISAADAEAWNLIRDGPRDEATGERLWHGLVPGADLAPQAGEEPFNVGAGWIRYFLTRDPDLDLDTIGYARYAELFRQSVAEFGGLWATDEPDLSAFRAAGGKMVTWHGLADQLIPFLSSVEYWEAVGSATSTASAAAAAAGSKSGGRRKRGEAGAGAGAGAKDGGGGGTDGGKQTADDFYRLFLAPGVGHCFGGAGPAPSDPLAAVVAWVEEGRAPETLAAEGNGQARDLCRHPRQLEYRGSGDVASAASWVCVGEGEGGEL